MTEIDQVTGLPKEFGIGEALEKETQKIKIMVVKKRYGKYMTVIKGLDKSKLDLKDLLRKLKSKLACGGTYKNDEIELQGEHKERVRKILVGEGFPEEIIEVQ